MSFLSKKNRCGLFDAVIQNKANFASVTRIRSHLASENYPLSPLDVVRLVQIPRIRSHFASENYPLSPLDVVRLVQISE